MGTIHRRLLAALAALTLSLPHAVAASNEFGVAVIIGNKEYADDDFRDVSYAHNDAEAFKRFVTGELGFDANRVIDLRDATKTDMEGAFGVKGNEKGTLWKWMRRDGSSDVVVFYSGHGMEGSISDTGRRPGYLLPVDTKKDRAELNGYPIELLYENLGKLPSKSVTVYLDACFSGVAGESVADASPVSRGANISGVSGEPGFAVLTAASGNQLASWDREARHGLFTEHLLDGLYGAADKDGNGRVTAREAKLYLDDEMTSAARSKHRREQDAGLHGDASAVLSFSSMDGWGSRPSLGPPPVAFTVLVEPAEARVRILNIGASYRAGMELAAGSYEVEASAPGYVTKTETTAHGASPTVQRIVLRKVGGRFRDCPECPEMAVLPAGSYRMGSPSHERARREWEGPVHEVTIAAPFALGVYEVTVAEFGRFVDETGYSAGSSCHVYYKGVGPSKGPHLGASWRSPSFGQGERHPVACVNWNDAQAYAAWLSREAGEEYRLPSESEWEYAARAGTITVRYWGEGESSQCRHANGACREERHGYRYTTPVGSLTANGWGLHDMLGNVWEWTEDCWNGSYGGAPSDGSAWEYGECDQRVLRGGSWLSVPENLRAAARVGQTSGRRFSTYGFRVARTLTP